MKKTVRTHRERNGVRRSREKEKGWDGVGEWGRRIITWRHRSVIPC